MSLPSPALHRACLSAQDDEGFAASCAQGRDLGFDGKTLIHPRTVSAANAAFSPTEQELAFAHRVVAAAADAQEQFGLAVLDGRLVEALHVQEARRLLALDAAIRTSRSQAQAPP